VTKHVDANVASAYDEELAQRASFLDSLLHADYDDDEHIFVERENDGVMSQYAPRYNLDNASYYSRLQLPIRAPDYAVPIRQGLFTTVSAWSAQEQIIKVSRQQLVLLEYHKGSSHGCQITVFKNIYLLLIICKTFSST